MSVVCDSFQEASGTEFPKRKETITIKIDDDVGPEHGIIPNCPIGREWIPGPTHLVYFERK